MAGPGVAGLPPHAAVRTAGQLIDVACRLGEQEGLRRAIDWCAEIGTEGLPPADLSRYHYCVGTAHQGLRDLRRHASPDHGAWEDSDTEKALVHLRTAVRGGTKARPLPPTLECRVLTNLSDLFLGVGQPIAAIEYLTKTLESDPGFGMALSNRGRALWAYARADYDPGHSRLAAAYARRDLLAGIALGVERQAAPVFRRLVDSIERRVSLRFLCADHDMESFSLGDTAEEEAYRRWCLGHGLFLNTLNDLGPYPIAARDILHLPSIHAPIEEQRPRHHAMYNQMKQEFASCRYLLYEGLCLKNPHFSDRDVLLYDAMDDAALCLALEKTRAAYRIAYSVLDKIACFVHDYFGVTLTMRKVNFRTVWYVCGKRVRGLAPRFGGMRNWPLKALFWLSKDIAAEDGDFADAIEPDASETSRMRNYLEHRVLQLCHGFPPESDDWGAAASGDPSDAPMIAASRAEFEGKALRLAKTARAALVYLSLAVHAEERQRRVGRSSAGVVPQIQLVTIADDAKR